MGLTDEIVEGVYKWTDTATEPEFTDWIPGMPDDFHHSEDCVAFWNDKNYLWNDAGCGSTLEAVCELT